MSAPPYMKLYVADYLGDTHHLSAIEHGAYMLLLMGMWRAGGTLPAADANLARLARCTPAEWEEVKVAVLPFFKRSRGKLTHKRVTSEMAKYETVSRHRSEAGKAGAAKKAMKDSVQAQANAVVLPTKPEPEPEPYTPTSVGVSRTPAAAFEEWWSRYPSQVAKPAARRAFLAALDRTEGDDPAAILIDGLDRALASARWRDPTYTIPNPANWLNDDRWLDGDVVVLRPSGGPSPGTPAAITVPAEIHAAVSQACGDTFADGYLSGAIVQDGQLMPKTRTAWERLTGNRHAVAALRGLNVQLLKPQPYNPADERMIGAHQ